MARTLRPPIDCRFDLAPAGVIIAAAAHPMCVRRIGTVAAPLPNRHDSRPRNFLNYRHLSSYVVIFGGEPRPVPGPQGKCDAPDPAKLLQAIDSTRLIGLNSARIPARNVNIRHHP